MGRSAWLPLVVALAACAPKDVPGRVHADLFAVDVRSRKALEVAPMNRRLALAHAAKEPWAADPQSIVRTLLQPSAAFEELWAIECPGESHSDCRVVVIVDGFTEDSVRGDRYDASLTRGERGMWEIHAASIAWRCWRTRSSAFGTEPCP